MEFNKEMLYRNLTDAQISLMEEQVKRFKRFSMLKGREIEIDDKIIFPNGTLIHGTPYNKDTLISISKTGIITGQAFGIEEDGETFCCADFHRVSSDISLEDYNNSFPYTDGRCPFGSRGKNTVSFVIYPNDFLDDIVSYDCYRDGTKESSFTKSFVNMKGLPNYDKEKLSSILFGVPASFINGIILGDKLIREDVISFIREIFPRCFITKNNGELLYKKGDTKEIMDIRLKSVLKTISLEEKERNIRMMSDNLKIKEDEIQKLWNAIAGLSVE